IITGDGAGNTTQGWFGPSDAMTDPSSAMPEGGYGRLNIRYNPYRALPNGINIGSTSCRTTRPTRRACEQGKRQKAKGEKAEWAAAAARCGSHRAARGPGDQRGAAD